jgi:hypothetical protein
MIKLVLWFVRKPGITAEELFNGNHRVHGDLVRGAPADFRAQILRYTQSYPFDAAYGQTGAQFDGVSELWYESPEAMRANLAHPYYRDVVRPDGANFADERANVVHLAAEEVVEPPLRGQGVKVVRWLQAPAGVDPAAFDAFWTAAHEDARAQLTGLLGYARNRVPPGAPAINGTPPTGYDALWLDGHEDIPALQRSTRRLLADGESAGMLDPARCFYLLCSERRVVDTLAERAR